MQSDGSLNHSAIVDKYQVFEKFLRVSDFIKFIMENKSLFSVGENPDKIYQENIKFLRGMQFHLDYEKIAKQLLLNNFHVPLIFEL
jgi:hypothetical protein